MAQVFLTTGAKEDLHSLDGSARKLVLKAVAKLETSPEQRGEPLGSRASGNLTGLRKLVVGDKQYRIVFHVSEDGTVTVVWVIGSRVDAECYDTAMARIAATSKNSELARALQGLLGTAFGIDP